MSLFIVNDCHFQEAVIEIQYVKRDAAPELGETLSHDDWVSAVRANNSL